MKAREYLYGAQTLCAIKESVHPSDFKGEFHVHRFFELDLILAGSGHYETVCGKTARSVPVKPNQLLFWQGTRPHRAVDSPGDPMHQIVAMFSHDALGGFAIQKELPAFFKRHDPAVITSPVVVFRIKHLLREIMSEQYGKRPYLDDAVRARFAQMAVEILRVADVEPKEDRRIDTRIQFVVEHLKKNYHEPLSVGLYANYLSITPRRFTDLFRKSTGTTFVHFLNEYRVELTKEMLLAGEKKISTIAFEVGFETLSNFNKVFRAVAGVTPVEYRKTHSPAR